MVEVVHQGNIIFFFAFAILTILLQFELLRLNQSTKATSSTIRLAYNYTLIHLGREYHSIFYTYAVCLHKPSARLYPSNVVEKQKSSLNALCPRKVRVLLALVVWHFKESLITCLVNLANQKLLVWGWLAISFSRAVRAEEKH